MASVLITGTSKGIGLATALTLGRAGHEVYATMRDPSQAPELAERTAHEKLPIKISVMDVDSDTSVKTAIANIQKDAGPIDVLVNNAGVERSGSVEELPLTVTAVTLHIKPQTYPNVDDDSTIVLTYPHAQAIIQG